MSESEYQQIGKAMKGAERILIVSHVRPDGDAVGSLIGLGLALQEAGKAVQMVLNDGVPTSFRHLTGSNQVVKHPGGNFDLTIVLDCSDLPRVGKALTEGTVPDINIDHHITNLNFARINLVKPDAVATSAILAEYLPEWGFPVTPQVASALLTGLISDTLGFRTSNMTPQVMRLAATLMEIGTNLPELYSAALVRRSFESARYWGAGLSHLERRGRLVWATLSLDDRSGVNYPGNDDADLINVLSTIDGADVALIFVEQKGGKTKVSWRSQPGVDVSQIALKFGGGGHAAASGAEITGSLVDVQERVIHDTLAFLEASANVLSDEN
ncbi:MAG: bifunctional oligoribonuclease/PAP phosphatase NrnA [Chloroflexi bacterium]|nr:bifunctional oligoribonuclease/PAP phosphatase NrnA [Chloroflexota bacterium]